MNDWLQKVDIVYVLSDTKVSKKDIRKRVSSEERSAILDLTPGNLASTSPVSLRLEDSFSESEACQLWIDGRDYAPLLGDESRQEYLEWISSISNARIFGTSSIKDLFQFEGETSMWWFTNMSEKHAVHHRYKWLFYQIHVLKHLSQDREAPDNEWCFWVDNRYVGSALASACDSELGVTISVLNDNSSNRVRETLKSFTVVRALHSLKRGVKKVFQDSKELFREVWLSNSSRDARDGELPLRMHERDSPLVLFHTRFPKSWSKQTSCKKGGGSGEMTERYFQDAPSRFLNKGFQVGWLPEVDTNTNEDWEQITQNQSILDTGPWMTLTWGEAVKIVLARLKWLIVFIWVFVIHRVQEEWRYKDIPLGYWLRRTYEKEILGGGSTWNQTMINLYRYRSVCNTFDPDCVLYRDEFYRSSGRQLSAALKGKAHLLGVQHGMIDRDHTVYQWQRNDIPHPADTSDPDHIKNAPVPDRILAFGEYYVEQFDEWNGYPADLVIPTGGLRHDHLVEEYCFSEAGEDQRDYNQKKTLRNELALPSESPVLLLCTGLASMAENWFRMTVEGLSQAGVNAFVAVKLHQYHGGGENIRSAAEELGFSNYSVYDEGIYPLMAASDLLVSSTSTTVLEGSLLGLSAITIVANSEYEPYPFSREKLARVVSSKQEMSMAIRELLAKGTTHEETSSPNIHRHLRNFDAGACERTASLIRRAVGQRNEL